MLKWLAKKGEDARVYMCVKEVKWDLEQADMLRRATLLVHAQRFRLEFTGNGNATPAFSCFDLPLAHSRTELFEIYEALETIRNNIAYQFAQTQKALAHRGIMLPAYAIEHSKNVNRGLEIWMCTLGSGIVPGVRDEVRTIWTLLSQAQPYVIEAAHGLHEIARNMAAFTGSDSSDMFDGLADPEFVFATEFVPMQFRY